MWNNFIEPRFEKTSSNISAVDAAETKSPQVTANNSKILRSMEGGKFLSLTDILSGAGVCLHVN